MEASRRKVLELVVYKLHEGASREQFLGTNHAVSSWISRQPGFISRELVYDGEVDRWVDIVWWESLEQAQAAMELSMSSDACAPFFALIDNDSMLMLHGEPAVAPVAAAAPVGA